MAICFVIQPFDSGKFDKRFLDINKPAIESAGLEAYRVDNDPSVLVSNELIVPSAAFLRGIKTATSEKRK